MNKNAKAWVKALRSGKYKQGEGVLRVEDKYCCLGVACELAGVADIINNGEYFYGGGPYVLPQSVQEWLGLDSMEGSYEKGNRALSSDNDVGKTFEVIADIIESEPEGLFA